MLDATQDLTNTDYEGGISPFSSLPNSDSNQSVLPSSGQPIAFVDSALDNLDNLIASLGDATVYVIDAQQDGASYIGSVLSDLNNAQIDISSIHILAHGNEGALQLGATTLTSDNLIGYSDDLAQWGNSATGDVLLYGCDVAKGPTGNAFIDQLAAITGADIQASNDLTGSATLGGDWDLEVTHGSIETGLLVSAAGQATYQGTLASPVITSNGGGDTAAITVPNGTSFITDVNVTGANGFFEGFGVEYYFSGGLDSYLFDIDVDTGEVTFAGGLDVNNPLDVGGDNVYDINVLAIDWTGASDTQAISITVANDQSLAISGGSEFTVSDGSTFVTDLNVTGAGGGFTEGNGVEYYFFGGQDSYLFDLNTNTGELSFSNAPNGSAPIDANGDNIYEVGILAIDYTGQSTTSDLNITVDGPSSGGQLAIAGGTNFVVDDDETFVTDLNVTGAGGGFTEGNGVEYYFFGGQDSYLFNLNTNNGQLSFQNEPDDDEPADANGDNIYEVGVLAIDYTGQQVVENLTIQVQEDDDGPSAPVITSNGGGDSAVIEITEGTNTVTDVSANAANGFSEGNGFTYSLNAGDDADRFNIDPNSGVISFTSTPDFENPTDTDGNNVYFANVLVQDPTGASDSQFLSIVVTDVTESGSAPVITSSGGGESAFIQTPENSTFAVDVQATDADGESEGNGITYRINAGEDANQFDIDQNTGVISFKTAPDFENPTDSDGNNIYRINVLAEDSTGRADSQFIQIEVTNKVAVYLLGGQSNMAGATSDANFLAGTPQGNPFPDVQIWNGGINAFTDLRPGFNDNFGVGGGFGAEIGFGHALEAARENGQTDNGEEIYLVKYAIGATDLATDWNVNGNNNIYDDFTQWVGDALARLAGDGIGYDVEGMLWMQGENDAINASSANSYQSNLNNLIADVRGRYGADLDFVIGRLHEELTPFFYTEANTVRQAQSNVANSAPNNFLVDTDGLPVNPIDGVHFDSAGHLALGEAFANIFTS
ncbi:MAG: DUF4347 domain-containing protein [Phormidesmis sp.]